MRKHYTVKEDIVTYSLTILFLGFNIGSSKQVTSYLIESILKLTDRYMLYKTLYN